MSCDEHLMISRRLFLAGGSATLALWSALPRAIAAQRDPRLLFVILRGGMDGLGIAAPVGDPDYARHRNQLALGNGNHTGYALDNLFMLHPSMPNLSQLYKAREALFLHAVATPYRGRSHFDGQDVLESGGRGVGATGDGWLSRALSGMTTNGTASVRNGLSIGPVVPLVMRGKAPVVTWSPSRSDYALNDSTVARLVRLYRQTDPHLAAAISQGTKLMRLAASSGDAEVGNASPSKGKSSRADGEDGKMSSPGMSAAAGKALHAKFIETASAAAKFMSAPDGPRVGVLSYNGWDTHANEGSTKGVLANQLAALDSAIVALKTGMQPIWKDTVVMFATEFGRTVRVNGTNGTDHGTGTVTFLVGGAVKGGRIITDWPGLAEKELFEARDLRPTRDIRAIFKGVLQDHLGIPKRSLGTLVFPESTDVPPHEGLLL